MHRFCIIWSPCQNLLNTCSDILEGGLRSTVAGSDFSGHLANALFDEYMGPSLSMIVMFKIQIYRISCINTSVSKYQSQNRVITAHLLYK